MKPRISALLMISAIGGCYTGTQDLCPKHCWEFTQPVENDNGDFLDVCWNVAGTVMFTPNVPAPAVFEARECVDTQDEHDTIKLVIEAIRTCGQPCVDLLDQSDEDFYDAFCANEMLGEGLGPALRGACRQHLGSQGCDVTDDSGTNHVLAWDLCEEYVVGPAVAAMKDYTGCAGWIPPHEVTPEYKPTDPYDCDYHLDLATSGADDDGPVCDDGEDDGMDEESGAPLLDDPFGDLGNLVDCGQPTTCTIEPELLANVTENFQTFYDEEVWLEVVNIPFVSRGVQITGVDANEDVEALLDAFGIEDEDVITHVNGIYLEGEEDMLEALYEIPRATSWSVTVRRWNGMSWGTLNYSISLAM